MTADDTTGKYIPVFTAADNYGIFKFRLLYSRRGYSVLHAETQISIRPFKHSEYASIEGYPESVGVDTLLVSAIQASFRTTFMSNEVIRIFMSGITFSVMK